MQRSTWHVDLYLLNLALLFTHEIDAAYWQEWKLLHLPGGSQSFLAINLVLLLAGLAGFRLLIGGRRSGRLMAWVLALAGLAACGLHLYFLLRGGAELRLPASLAVLAATLLLSLAQAVTLARRRVPRRHSPVQLPHIDPLARP